MQKVLILVHKELWIYKGTSKTWITKQTQGRTTGKKNNNINNTYIGMSLASRGFSFAAAGTFSFSFEAQHRPKEWLRTDKALNIPYIRDVLLYNIVYKQHI